LPLIGQNHTLKINLHFCEVFVPLELTENFSAVAFFFFLYTFSVLFLKPA
jgi:hypothetical protein